MKQVIYNLQFFGGSIPAGESPTRVRASTTAVSCRMTTRVGEDGLSGLYEETEGAAASFESDIVFTGEDTFQETGTISFGESGDRLWFETVGEGSMGPSPDPEHQAGAVIWRVVRGEGRLAGASGLITSNFLVGSEGAVTDHQVGVLFVQD